MLSKKHYWFPLLCMLMFSFATTVQAGKVEKAFEALSQHNYFKAKEIFQKLRDKKPIESGYGLSYIYATNNNPFYNLDSARKYILKAEEVYAITEDKDRGKLKELQIDSIRLQILKTKVGRLAFEEAKAANDLNTYQTYIALYDFALEYPEAVALRDELAFERARKRNTYRDYEQFMQKYPASVQFNEAKRRYDKTLYLEETKSGKIAAYVNFIQKYPESPYAIDAMDMIYKQSIHHNSIDEYARFIKNHPENRNVQKAWRILYALYMKDYSQERMAEFRLDYPNYPFKDELMKDFSLSFKTFYPIKKDGKWGFIDQTGDVMVKPQYDWVSPFSEGLSAVSKGNKVGFIDKLGNLKIPLEYGEVEAFKDGYAIVQSKGKYGVINKANLVQIPLVYDEIGEFIDGIASIAVGEKYGFIDINNNRVVDLVYDACGDFENGYAYVALRDKYGVIDRRGEVVIPIEFDWLETFKDGLARVRKGDKFGIYNIFGTQLTPLAYDNLGVFSDGLCLASVEDKLGYLDVNGEMKIEMKYEFELAAMNWGMFHNAHAKVKVNGKFALIDTSGNRLLPAVFEDVGQFSPELIAVKKRGKWGFCDLKAKLIIPYRYDYAWGFMNDSLSKVRKDEKMGYINMEGNEEIYVVYDEISEYIKGRAKITKDAQYGLVDRFNNIVIPAEYDEFEYEMNLIRAVKDGLMHYLDPKNGSLIWKEQRR